MTHEESLLAHFEELKLPPDAAAWLLGLWDVIQVFDDIYDRDEVSSGDILRTLWRVLVSMPANPFYRANEAFLTPVLANAICKWQAANSVEGDGKVTETSFVWRASYYDVVMSVVTLCHGPDKAFELAPIVLGLYGEKYADYVKEFENA